jgi:uncharacterized protein (TIGR02145 family)
MTFGYLYNFYTASAGTANYGSTDKMDGDICPGSASGTTWHIPTGRDNGEYAMLNGMMAGDGAASTSTDQAHASNWLSTGAWQGVLSGDYDSDFSYQGSYGIYWSSSVGSSTSGYYMSFDSSYVGPGIGDYYRYYGHAVRCML